MIFGHTALSIPVLATRRVRQRSKGSEKSCRKRALFIIVLITAFSQVEHRISRWEINTHTDIFYHFFFLT